MCVCVCIIGNYTKKILMTQVTTVVWSHSSRGRHPPIWSQVGHRKHHYKQNYWKRWNSSCAISNPKDDAVKVLHSICQKIWKTQQLPQDSKRSVFIPVPKKNNAREHSNYHTIALISHNSKVILKVLQARLQHYVKQELPGVQAGFRKGRGTREKTANTN